MIYEPLFKADTDTVSLKVKLLYDLFLQASKVNQYVEVRRIHIEFTAKIYLTQRN